MIDDAPTTTPAVDFVPQWPLLGDTEIQAVTEVTTSGLWGSGGGGGTAVRRVEQDLARRFGTTHGFAVSSGTMALAAALSACGVDIGDEVIVPPYTFIATASAALFLGAVPVFADVRPDNHLIDPDAVAAAVTERTRAIIPVHLGGGVADMDAVTAIARKHGLRVVEDCAQAAGASWKGRPAGSLGDVGVLSFQASKNLTAGEGGAALTDDPALADALYSMVNVGRRREGGWYEHVRIGYNLRMTEFQGAVLHAQLQRFDAYQERLEQGARLLTQLLAGVEGVVVDAEDERWSSHGRHLFLMRFPGCTGVPGRRDALVAALQREGLGASGGYVPLHRNEALVARAAELSEKVGRTYTPNDCPVTDQMATDTVWLHHPWLAGTPSQLEQVAEAVTRVCRRWEREEL